jgi:hypothetical protein
MRLKRMIVMLAAAASLGIGIGQAIPAYAAQAAPAPHAQAVHASSPHLTGSTELLRRGLLRSRSVNTMAAGGCAQFQGTLYYYTNLIGGTYEQTYDVVGTLYQHCSGYYTRLYADYQCDNYTPQGPRIGERTTVGSTRISWGSPECSYPMTNMRVELCFHSSTRFACGFSAYL